MFCGTQTNQIDHEVYINAIKQRPALWQTKHPDHRNQKVKRLLWVEIQQSLPIHVDVEDLKKKWKNLKDAYRKEVKKVSMLQSSDPLATNVQSQWVHYPYMEFLREEIAKEDWEIYVPPTAHPLVTVKVEPGEGGVLPDDLNEEQDRVVASQPELVPMPSPQGDATPHRRSSTSSSSEATAEKAKKRPKNASDLRTEYLEIERKKLKILEKELTYQNMQAREVTKSDDYHFVMSILPEMMKLPPIHKMRVRNRINQVLMDEMNEFSNANGSAFNHT